MFVFNKYKYLTDPVELNGWGRSGWRHTDQPDYLCGHVETSLLALKGCEKTICTISHLMGKNISFSYYVTHNDLLGL